MTAHDTEARALVALYDEHCNLTAAIANAEHPTGDMAQAAIDKGQELAAACEVFRRRHYPRKAEVFVGLWTVMARSARGRSIVTVLDLFDEYRALGASA